MASGGEAGFDDIDGGLEVVHSCYPAFPAKSVHATASETAGQQVSDQPVSYPDASVQRWLIERSWVLGYGITCQGSVDVFVKTNKDINDVRTDIAQGTSLPERRINIMRQSTYASIQETSFLGGSVQCEGQDIVIGGLLMRAPPSDDIYGFTVSHHVQQGAEVSWICNDERRVFGTVECSIKENPESKMAGDLHLGMSVDFAIITVSAECAEMCRQALVGRNPVPLYQYDQLPQASSDEFYQVTKWGPASNKTKGYLQYPQITLKQPDKIISAVGIKDKDCAFHQNGDSGSLVRCRRCHVAVGLLFKRATIPLEGQEIVLSMVTPLAQALTRAAQCPQFRFLADNPSTSQVYYVGP